MKNSILIIVLAAMLLACKKRLDSFLFNPSTDITSYELDAYTGTTSLDVGSEYAIPADKIHKFTFNTQDEGENLATHAIYVGDLSTISTDTVILYCHGNAKHMDFYWCRQKLYANLGSKNRFGVLMFDYPGFGLSEGKPTESNMYASTKAALQWLKDQGLTSDRLVIYGFSLGSAPSCEVASHTSEYPLQPSKIILEAPFASSEVMVQSSTGLSLPASFVTSVKIDNAEEIKNVTIPLLWIHGEDDGFLAIDKHGEIVYNNHPGLNKTAVRVMGGDHENTPFVYGYPNYLNSILNFITQ